MPCLAGPGPPLPFLASGHEAPRARALGAPTLELSSGGGLRACFGLLARSLGPCFSLVDSLSLSERILPRRLFWPGCGFLLCWGTGHPWAFLLLLWRGSAGARCIGRPLCFSWGVQRSPCRAWLGQGPPCLFLPVVTRPRGPGPWGLRPLSSLRASLEVLGLPGWHRAPLGLSWEKQGGPNGA